MRTERVGFAVCGSFCTHEKVLEALARLTEECDHCETQLELVHVCHPCTPQVEAGALLYNKTLYMHLESQE